MALRLACMMAVQMLREVVACKDPRTAAKTWSSKESLVPHILLMRRANMMLLLLLLLLLLMMLVLPMKIGDD